MNFDPVAVLKISTKGADKSDITLFDGQTFAVGRDEKNELVLIDKAVSRIHACFTASKHGLVLSDLSSRNGTFLNGQRITTFRELLTGDVVDIGATKIKIYLTSESPLGLDRVKHQPSLTLTSEIQRQKVIVLVIGRAGQLQADLRSSYDENVEFFSNWKNRFKEVAEKYNGMVDKDVKTNFVVGFRKEDNEQVVDSVVHFIKEVRAIEQKESGIACGANLSYFLSAGIAIIQEGDVGCSILGEPLEVLSKIDEPQIIATDSIIITEELSELFCLKGLKIENICKQYSDDKMNTYYLRLN